MLFIDFDTGTVVQIAARAEIRWDDPDLAAFPDAQRLLRLQLLRVRRIEGALALRWTWDDED